MENDEDFKKRFPALTKELSMTQSRIKIDGVRTNPDNQTSGRQISGKNWQGYDPDIIDFIRRAKSEKEAIEVIDYMLHREEISKPYAKRLITQLNEEGLKSFGSSKKIGYYFNPLDG